MTPVERAARALENALNLYVEPDAKAVRNMPYVCDHEATSTGLLDKNGDAIWRAPNPIGFIWD
jgi:hypothetical protein